VTSPCMSEKSYRYASSGVRRKFSWGGFHSVAYGGHLCLVCAVCDVTSWHDIHVFKRSLL